jgi:hypothetical protein
VERVLTVNLPRQINHPYGINVERVITDNGSAYLGWGDPLRSVRSHESLTAPLSGEEDDQSDGTCETPAYAGADHQEAA